MIAVYLCATVYHQDGATTDLDTYVAPSLPGSWEVVGLSFTPDSGGAATTDNTEWRKLTFSVAGTAIAQITTDANGSPAGAALTAGTPATFGTALNAGASNLCSSTVPLKLESLHNGNTGRVMKGTTHIVWRQVR